MISGQLSPARRLEENTLIYQRDVEGNIFYSFPLTRAMHLGWSQWHRLGKRCYKRGKTEAVAGRGRTEVWLLDPIGGLSTMVNLSFMDTVFFLGGPGPAILQSCLLSVFDSLFPQLQV